MNILEASQKLLSFFEENDHFDIDKNFKEIITIIGSQKADRAAILCALEELEKMELVKSREMKDGKETKNYYILTRGLETYEQNITVSYQTSYMIASVVNSFCEKIEDKQDWVDIKNIEEKDIRNTAIVARHYEEQVNSLMGLGEEGGKEL